jgi:nucleoside-diphosphate-sugar epimerase
MRIVVLGGNGQVGAEVCLLLARMPGVELVPVSRSRNGSAFLRQHGIAVAHGDVSDPGDATRMMDGADLVANFALATGTPAATLASNARIISNTFEFSPPSAKIAFFSTLAVVGRFDERRGAQRSSYGNLKLANEQQVEALSKAQGRVAYSLRLGHVLGPFQRIWTALADELRTGPVPLVDGTKASNVTFTVAVAEALIAIATHRAGSPGRYDLVNTPQWSWDRVYREVATREGLSARFVATLGTQAPPVHRRAIASAISLVNDLGLKDLVLRAMAVLPATANDRAKAEAYVDRARREIVELEAPLRAPAAAQLWPALQVRPLPGVRATEDLLAAWNDVGTLPNYARRWPSDLA